MCAPERDPPRDLKAKQGFHIAFMFYECQETVGCLLIIKAVFMTSPKGKQERKGSKCIFLQAWDESLTFSALGELHGLEDWKIKLGMHVQESEKL